MGMSVIALGAYVDVKSIVLCVLCGRGNVGISNLEIPKSEYPDAYVPTVSGAQRLTHASDFFSGLEYWDGLIDDTTCGDSLGYAPTFSDLSWSFIYISASSINVQSFTVQRCSAPRIITFNYGPASKCEVD